MKSFQDIKEGYLQNANSDDEEGDVESEEENFETDTVAVTIKPILTTSSHLLMNHRQTIERLDNKKKKPSVKKEEHSTKLTMNFGEEEDANDDEEEEEDDKSKPSDGTLQAITSKKDLNKILKQTARSFMKKSKVVQKKNLANHKKNVKFSQRKKFKIEKKLKKHKKLKKWINIDYQKISCFYSDDKYILQLLFEHLNILSI